MTQLLVTYDIATTTPAGERRLRAVAAICERYGHRAQYSVFECQLDHILEERLITELLGEIEPAEDSIHLYRLSRPFDEVRQSLGRSGRDWNQPNII